jgi:hypothetical protein
VLLNLQLAKIVRIDSRAVRGYLVDCRGGAVALWLAPWLAVRPALRIFRAFPRRWALRTLARKAPKTPTEACWRRTGGGTMARE